MSTKKAFGVLALLTLIGLIYSYKHLSSYPSSIHTWAQADRYALALGFVDNNLNLFKPQTLIFNHQFPGEWKIAREQRITAVDFPVHDYIPAVIMKISGSKSPLIFRLYIFLFSLVGLYFLFRLSFLITENYYKSFFVCIFAATSPVFVFYQANFLPSIPCIASSFIGLYLYLKYVKHGFNRFLAVSLLFLTVAALSRSTYLISLLVITGVESLRLLKHQVKFRLVHFLFLVPFAFILVYQLYNCSLREKYGSDFLNYLLPPANLSSALEMITITIKNWGNQYFSVYHWLSLGIIVFAGLIYYKRSRVNSLVKWVIIYCAVLFLGVLLFSFVMLQQFPDHDYYFLDTFYIPLIFVLIICLGFIQKVEKGIFSRVINFALVVLVPIFFYQPVKSQNWRYNSAIWNKTHATVENFYKAEAFLDSTGISKKARLLVLDAVGPNIPFALMGRTGYAVMDPSKENIIKALQWPYDFIVIQDEYLFNEIRFTFPDLLPKLHRVAGNNKISVYRLIPQQNEDPLVLIKRAAGHPAFTSRIGFEGNSFKGWTNLKLNDSIVYAGNFAGYLSPEDEFGLTLRSENLPVLKTNSTSVFVTFQMFRQKAEGCILVVKINSNNKSIHYREFDLQELPHKGMEWQPVELMFKLPRVAIENYELSVYLWNPRKREMFYDNFSIEIADR